MKKLNIFTLAAAALLAAGCSKDANKESGEKNGVLTVKIASDPATRALIDGTNTDAAVTAFEGRVTGFSAYVFNWATGDLEGSATSADGSAATITGLNTASQKRVVVIANGVRTTLPNSFIPQFETDPNYARIDDGYVALADQAFTDFSSTTQGFLMTGENPTAAQLQVDDNTIAISVKRVVAKVQLGTISFDERLQLADLAKFSLSGASMQRAATYATLGTGDITTPTTPTAGFVGGELGSRSAVPAYSDALESLFSTDTYLNDLFVQLGYTGVNDPSLGNTTIGQAMAAEGLDASDITPYAANAFWYVLPNPSATSYTLLTLKGSYGGTTQYYPLEVNDADATGPSVTQDFIKRNTIYTVNVKFKSNLSGTADPDVPGEVAQLEVTVVPAPWAGPVVQEVTW